MEKPSSVEHDERQLSIQNEPKALCDKEIKLAREAAQEVINNNSEEEALKIFLQEAAAAAAEVRPLTLQSKFERGISKGKASTSATKADQARTELKVQFP